MKKFEQFSRHLQVLRRADKEDITNEFIISGVIDKFYIQFELGWKVLKDYIPLFEKMEQAVKNRYSDE